MEECPSPKISIGWKFSNGREIRHNKLNKWLILVDTTISKTCYQTWKSCGLKELHYSTLHDWIANFQLNVKGKYLASAWRAFSILPLSPISHLPSLWSWLIFWSSISSLSVFTPESVLKNFSASSRSVMKTKLKLS